METLKVHIFTDTYYPHYEIVSTDGFYNIYNYEVEVSKDFYEQYLRIMEEHRKLQIVLEDIYKNGKESSS